MTINPSEKALLVGVEFQNEKLTLTELENLANTAGAVVVGSLTQKRSAPDPKYYIGSGKLEELINLINLHMSDLVIFDHELSPGQERNLENKLGVKVIDRTELILDIFAQHAKTREGKLQVKLAQREFLLTRLTGHGILMSRLGGGIGTRGPGESKLEYDRRRIRTDICALKKEIEKLRTDRQLKRERRRSSRIKTAVIVGYTNAGKSSLINALTKAGTQVEDKLFATLDPTTRRLYLPSGNTILITDTVGFIQKLPHDLVDAFQATLEEVSEADLLVHVVDLSNPEFESQINAVYVVLEELKAIGKPIITVFNKIDRLNGKKPEELLKKYAPAVFASTLCKEGLDQVLLTIDAQLQKLRP